MAWSKRVIESVTEKKLKSLLSTEPGEERFARYLRARKKLVEDILPEIKLLLPSHTDHGERHVSRVMDNVAKLIGLESADAEVALSGMDLYCLIMAVLFHDVGNVFGREEHQRKVAGAYDYVFAGAERDVSERKIVLVVTGAHCGDAVDGSKNTLKELIGDYQLDKHRVRVREISALLRLADELDEGPERTSIFMQQHHRYTPESEIYHRYTEITDPCIDRGNKRIALTYNINIDTGGTKRLSKVTERKLTELLKYTYRRISKLNQERKYNKFYCETLEPFKETAVTFDFLVDNLPFVFDFPPSVVLDDLVVPGEDVEKEFYHYNPIFKIDNVIKIIRRKLKDTTARRA